MFVRPPFELCVPDEFSAAGGSWIGGDPSPGNLCNPMGPPAAGLELPVAQADIPSRAHVVDRFAMVIARTLWGDEHQRALTDTPSPLESAELKQCADAILRQAHELVLIKRGPVEAPAKPTATESPEISDVQSATLPAKRIGSWLLGRHPGHRRLDSRRRHIPLLRHW